jgi:vancomycin permeability regulator SanA
LLTVAAALLLVAYAVAPALSKQQNGLAALACAALALVALRNGIDFYRAWDVRTFAPHVPLPFSLVLAAVLGLVGWAMWSVDATRMGGVQHLAAVVALVVVAALFPLAQIGFFGTSDYRAVADAAVVFGARANRGGSLSTSLADRVDTAVDLYRSGLVRTLVMSGGVSDSQVDEPDAMRAAAERAGVPASAILLDENGADTAATVANTTALFERDGIRRVLAVSQGYHLPRVKLAYMAAGLDVRTVPAKTSIPIPQTPLYMLREVPAFWQYWARSLVRG